MSKQALLDSVQSIQDEVVDASQADSKFLETNQRSVSKLAENAKKNPARKREFAEAAQVLGGVLSGKLPSYKLQEAMTKSDFPLLFGDVMDRLLLSGYRHAPANFTAFTRTSTVRDFRPVQRHYVDGADGILEEVGEQSEYPLDQLEEGLYSYRVKKFGRVLNFSWETLVNDDLDAFADMPRRLGRGARRSENNFVTKLYAGQNGFNTAFFNEANGNIIEGNPVLTMEGLLKAYKQMSKQVDPTTNEPIFNIPQVLVVPPELEIVAKQLVNATEIRQTEGDNQIISQNFLQNGLQVVVDYYLPKVSTDATPWFLFADPSEGRGALEFGRLRGHEEPSIMMKAPNATLVGGGAVNALQGDFETDSIKYKVRHVFGGTTMDPLYVVGSNGTGQ